METKATSTKLTTNAAFWSKITHKTNSYIVSYLQIISNKVIL